MISIRTLKHASLTIHAIEETLAKLDPYNHDFPDEENYSIQNCEFPEQVEDPLALVRLSKGDEFANRLEYEDHIAIILQHLTTCFLEELSRRGINEFDLDDYITTDDDDTEDIPENHIVVQHQVAS